MKRIGQQRLLIGCLSQFRKPIKVLAEQHNLKLKYLKHTKNLSRAKAFLMHSTALTLLCESKRMLVWDFTKEKSVKVCDCVSSSKQNYISYYLSLFFPKTKATISAKLQRSFLKAVLPYTWYISLSIKQRKGNANVREYCLTNPEFCRLAELKSHGFRLSAIVYGILMTNFLNIYHWKKTIKKCLDRAWPFRSSSTAWFTSLTLWD